MARIVLSVCSALLMFALLSPPAGAEPFDPATRSAIKDVISKQLDAFAREDPKTAEGYATPAIQAKFPEPQKFFEMVKKNYAPLVQPKSTQFGDTLDSPHGPLQKVTVVAPDGTVWTAIYTLEKIDGNWRISGCGLKREEGQQAI